MTWFDYVAILFVLWGCYVGYRDGFFAEILRLAGYAATVAGVYFLREPLEGYLTLNTFLSATVAHVASLAILIGGLFILTTLLAGLLIRWVKKGDLPILPRLGGLVMGAGRWAMIVCLVFVFSACLPVERMREDIQQKSWVGQKLNSVMPAWTDKFTEVSSKIFGKKSES